MKAFVFIYGSEIVLRFLASGAFSRLEAAHDLTYVVFRSEELLANASVDGELGSGRRVVTVPYYPERFRRWNELFDVSCILYRDRSPSFAVRYEERARHDPARFARLAKHARPARYEKHREAVGRSMGLHPEILGLTMRERPRFFVVPWALHFTDDVLQIATALRVPTLLLVPGWDNVSSKGMLNHQPTLVGVWGEQTKVHAIEIQNVDADRVHVVGAPHYESFRASPPLDRAARRAAWGLPPDGPLVLFAGTLRLFDETAMLQEMDEAIRTGALPPMHVLYRPHPWRNARQHEDNFFSHAWRHVTMDPDMAEAYRVGKETGRASAAVNFLSRMEYLARLYRSVDAVVSPMSSVLLEAMMCGLPTMAVAFGDGKHSWSADKVSQMLHFKELYEVPGVIVCRERKDFFPTIRQLVEQIGNESLGATLRKHSQYFLYQDHRSYGERVVELVDTMLSRVERPPAYDGAAVRPGRRFVVRNLARAFWQNSLPARALRRLARRLARGVAR